MVVSTADAPLLHHTDPARRRPSPTAIATARRALPEIVADILAIPEA